MGWVGEASWELVLRLCVLYMCQLDRRQVPKLHLKTNEFDQFLCCHFVVVADHVVAMLSDSLSIDHKVEQRGLSATGCKNRSIVLQSCVLVYDDVCKSKRIGAGDIRKDLLVCSLDRLTISPMSLIVEGSTVVVE